MSLGDGQRDSAAVLREMLSLYAGDASEWAAAQIRGLRSFGGRTVSRPLYEEVANGEPARIAAIVRGLEISLAFEESAFLNLGATVLGMVLAVFFARYVAVNSFAETVIQTTEGRERIRWPARPGLKPLI